MTSTHTTSPRAEIEQLFAVHGALIYGESVNQIEHALQCATLAETAGASESLIVAVLLHDVGHMMHRDTAGALQAGMDDGHEALGAKYLARWFGPAVTQPVALHVQAKRYLCALEPGYHASLSSISQRTLEIQGGPMSHTDIEAFEAQDYADDAVAVRRWDDLGKQAEIQTLPLAHFMAVLERCAAAQSSSAI